MAKGNLKDMNTSIEPFMIEQIERDRVKTEEVFIPLYAPMPYEYGETVKSEEPAEERGVETIQIY